jgi:hypothetical protein
MRGSCSRLLAILLVISFAILLSPPSATSQAYHLTPASDSAPVNPEFPAPSPTHPPKLIQPTPPRISPPVSRPPIGFPLLARTAGTIFSGTVTAVAHRSANNSSAIETVAITFHVEQAIRGATPGENLTIRQWMGVWSGGQRYRVGERVLLFLYPPSKLGLTSSVGGTLGRFAVDPVGRVLFTAQHSSAFQNDPVLGGKSQLRVSDFALAVRSVTEQKLTDENPGGQQPEQEELR